MIHPAAAENAGPNPARVLWISCVGEKGGAEVYMLNLLRRMRPETFRSTVAILRPGPLETDLRELGIDVIRFHPHRMRELGNVARTVFGLARVIRQREIRLVTSNGFRAHAYGGMAAYLAGVPATWITHTAETPGLATDLILRIPVAEVIANCPRTQAFFEGRGLRTTLLWPTVDEEQLAQFTPRSELAVRFGVAASSRWICMAARLQRYKGQEYFLHALASLPKSLCDVHGIVIGGSLFGQEPEYPAFLKQLAAELGITHRVHFTGFVEDQDVRGFVRASELLIHPALDEDFGMIVAEAQAMGKAVLAFASVGPASIVIQGVTGRLVPIADQTGLSHELGELLSSPTACAGYGIAGRISALKRFGACTGAQELVTIYSRHTVPAC